MSEKVEKNFVKRNIVKPRSVFDLWREEVILDIPEIKYDDIVDDSDFKPTAEQIRDNDFRSNGSATDPDSLQYDYEPNKIITEKVSDIVLSLRNGKLDKADVQKLNEALSKSLDKQYHDKTTLDSLKSAEEASKNRTKALDQLLNVNQDN